MTLAAEITADTPVAWWRLDETSGTSAADSAGTNTGTYTGSPTLNQTGLAPSDTPNRAVLFNNSTLQYVQVPHAAALNAASLTVQASIDATAINGNMRIVEKGNSDSGWSLRIDGSNLRWYVNGRVTVDYYFTDLGRHIVHGTYDAATGTGRLYLDGALVASVIGTAGNAPTPADPLRIAQKPGGSATSDGWNGLIDDVAVYPAVLSATRVAAHAAAVGLAGTPTLFTWKGYTWTRAARATAAPFSNAFTADHVTVDGSDVVHMTITNTGGARVGAEFACNTLGLGYGTYRCVVERAGGFNTLHPNVVFGGMFTFDGTSSAYGNREIDCCEQSAWSGATGPWELNHGVWMPSSSTNVSAARGGYAAAGGISTMTDQVQTHVMEWAPDKITFRSYHGTSTAPADLYRQSIVTAGQTVTFAIESGGTYTGPAVLPVPGNEHVIFNLWVCPNYSATSDPATVTATEVLIRDFSYAAPVVATRADDVLAALVSAATAAQVTSLVGVTVQDGPWPAAYQVNDPDFLILGGDYEAQNAAQSAVSTVATPSLMGNNSIDEQITIRGVAVSQSGDTAMSPRRARAVATVEALENLLTADPMLGGLLQSPALLSVEGIRQVQTRAGAYCAVNFTIGASALIWNG